MRQRLLPNAVAIAAALACGGALAQIRTDGTVGAAQVLKGPDYVIPQTLGKLSGVNLFHSFQAFSIGSSESATFTTSTSGIANVISRVTGGDVSQINGSLRLSAADGAPAFFFINPAGVTFGKGAAIDVPGAFHAGTADYVKFGDGRFYADAAKGSSFSSAPPEAFGFLGAARGLVTVKDGAVIVPKSGKAMTLAGGDIVIDNAALAASGGGDLRVVSMGFTSSEVPTSGVLPQGAGTLVMTHGGSISVGSVGSTAGGKLSVTAGDVLMDGQSYLYSRGATHATDAGAGGDIDVSVGGKLSVAGGSSISSDTAGAGPAGAIRIRAGQAQFSGGGYVYSSAAEGSAGSAGALQVNVDGALNLGNGSISSSAFGSGRAGAITVGAASLAADAGYISGEGGGGSAALAVTVPGALVLANGARIATSTDGAADAGSVSVKAGAAQLTGKAFIGSLAVKGSGNAGTVDLAVAGDVSLSGGSALLSTSDSDGASANILVTAANLSLDGGLILTNSLGTAFTPSGNVDVAVTGRVTLSNASAIDTSTLAFGNAGNVRLRANELALTGGSRISSSALDGFGNAGALDIATTGALTLQGASTLSTSSSTVGNAGDVRVSAGSILVESGSGINSTSGIDSLGRGGNVAVSTPGSLVLREQGHISAVAAGVGNAGNVQVEAGAVSLDGGAYISTGSNVSAIGNAGKVDVRSNGDVTLTNSAFINSDAFGTGNAGDVSVNARNILLDSAGRISSVTYVTGFGNGGRVTLNTSGDVVLANSSGQSGQAGTISTSTFSTGQGGAIAISAANVRVSGSGTGITSFAQRGSIGNAGTIDVQSSGDVALTAGGGISTSTASIGSSGAISVRAANVIVNNGGITSATIGGSQGNAGSVDVRASGNLTVTNAGAVSSSTFASGAAGSVRAEAARVRVEGTESTISAADFAGLSGQPGSVTVIARESITLRDAGSVSISNNGIVSTPAARQRTTLSLTAPDIVLQGGVVTAASSGNVAASAIDVAFTHGLQLDASGITTSANTGNGGPITVRGGELISLRQSQITTSVQGTTGNGGDIDITTHALALDRGFIQANTAASGASGGLVRIQVDSLVASGNTLLVGGNTAFTFRPDVPGFNVIQAAAPTGISGVVDVTSPVLDVTGSLRVLRGEVIDAGGLGRSLCQSSGGSTLAQAGRGGLVASSRGLLRAEREGSSSAAALSPVDGPGQPMFFGQAARWGYAAAPVHVASTGRGCL